MNFTGESKVWWIIAGAAAIVGVIAFLPDTRKKAVGAAWDAAGTPLTLLVFSFLGFWLIFQIFDPKDKNLWPAVACAATFYGSGAALGFLFGIPITDPTIDPRDTTAQPGRTRFKPNTSLEQISDWLTKILVGLGLTQLSEIREQFLASLTVIGKSLAPLDLEKAQVIAAFLIIWFSVSGFLYSYLVTRLFLTKLMAKDGHAP